jgi:hypothetical protein
MFLPQLVSAGTPPLDALCGLCSRLSHLSGVSPSLMSVARSSAGPIAGCRLHLWKHRTLSVGVLSLSMRSQRSKVWPLWVLTPSWWVEQCRTIVVVPLLLLLLLMHAGCVGIRDRARGWRSRARPDVRVRARRERLSQTIAMLGLRHRLIWWLIWCVR